MKTLYIDTHLYDIDIILFKDDEIIQRKIISGEKYNSPYLMPAIKDVCPDKDFDDIIVINGPGSFTGVRLGVTIAKTLAYTMHKKIRAVSYFDLMAFSSDSGKHIFGISDGNGYFIASYDNYVLQDSMYYLSNKDFDEFVKTNNVETDVSINYIEVLNRVSNIKDMNPHAVKPLYIKLIGVEQW